MLKNVAGQKIGAQLITTADGSAFTGSVTVAVTGDAGTQATGSVGSGACAHEGGGYHTYAPAQAETNYDLVAFTFSGTGAISVTVQVYTLPATGILAPTTAGRTLDVSATGEADANVVQLLGTAWLTPGTAGTPDVNAKLIGATSQTGADVGGIVSSGTHGNAALKTLIDTVDNFVDTEIADIQARLPAALGANGNLKADVRDWIGTAVATPTVAGVPEVDVTHMIGSTTNTSNLIGVGTDYGGNGFLTARVQGFSNPPETIGSTGNSTTTLHLANYTFGDDEINDMLVTIFDVSEGEYHSRWVDDWVVADKLATVATLPFAPQNATDIVYLYPIRRNALALTQAFPSNFSSLGINASGHVSRVTLTDTTTTNTDMITAAGIRTALGMSSANLDTQISTLATAAALDTVDNLIDTEIAAIQSTLASLFTTAITEPTYRTDGAAGSLAQLIYEINQTLGDRSISGTTCTVKKVDGVTTAFQQTLDSSSTPTSITHA